MLRIGMMAVNGRSGKDSASPLRVQSKGRSGILSASCGAISFNSSFTQTEGKLMKKLMMAEIAVCAAVGAMAALRCGA